MIAKIISGGQTGADRAALDVAIKLDIPHGGWVPKGRLAEDGKIPPAYQVSEMPTDSYSARTEKNVEDSDGTLILSHGKLTGGSAKTLESAQRHGRPFLHIDFEQTSIPRAAGMIAAWATRYSIKTLNVAGPRAGNDPLIYQKTKETLLALSQHLLETRRRQKRNPNESERRKPDAV